MRSLSLKKLSDNRVECCLETEGKRLILDVALMVDGDVRGLVLNGVSKEDKWRLYRSPESLDFTHQLWNYANGEEVQLPLTLKPRERVAT